MIDTQVSPEAGVVKCRNWKSGKARMDVATTAPFEPIFVVFEITRVELDPISLESIGNIGNRWDVDFGADPNPSDLTLDVDGSSRIQRDCQVL